jgi:hypothetical protein
MSRHGAPDDQDSIKRPDRSGYCRQCEAKSRALVWTVGLGPDLAPHRLDQGFGDREANAAPAERAAARLLDPIEALEDVRQMLSGDADTRVAHNELDRMLPSADDELDRAGGRRVPQRVGEQITEYLLCAVPIGSYIRQRWWHVDRESQPFLGELGPQAIHGISNEILGSDGIGMDLELSRLGPRKLLQVVDQAK